MTFDDLHERICDALRGNRPRQWLISETFLADGTKKIIRGKMTK
jgi:hypothetical protein